MSKSDQTNFFRRTQSVPFIIIFICFFYLKVGVITAKKMGVYVK